MNDVFIDWVGEKLKITVKGKDSFFVVVDRRTAMLIAISIMTEIDREDDAPNNE